MDDAPLAFQVELDAARKGLRSCLACRTAFPNRLGLLKHQTAGCRNAGGAAAGSN